MEGGVRDFLIRFHGRKCYVVNFEVFACILHLRVVRAGRVFCLRESNRAHLSLIFAGRLLANPRVDACPAIRVYRPTNQPASRPLVRRLRDRKCSTRQKKKSNHGVAVEKTAPDPVGQLACNQVKKRVWNNADRPSQKPVQRPTERQGPNTARNRPYGPAGKRAHKRVEDRLQNPSEKHVFEAVEKRFQKPDQKHVATAIQKRFQKLYEEHVLKTNEKHFKVVVIQTQTDKPFKKLVPAAIEES